MDKEAFTKVLTEFADKVRAEKGPNACLVYCKLETPNWFPPKNLMFAIAFERCVHRKDGATEKAWELYQLSSKNRGSQ